MSHTGILTTPRAAIMAVFSAFGAIMGTLAGSAPQLIADHGLDNATYGLGVTLMSAATVGSMGVSGTLARHFSHNRLLLMILPVFLLLLALLLAKGSTLAFFIVIALFGMASGITDVIMNAEAGAIELRLGKRVYTTFHGAASLAVAVFAILSSLLSTRYGTMASVAVTAIPVLAAMAMVHRNVPPVRLPIRSKAPDRHILSAFTPRLVLIGASAGFVIACEITALLWSSELMAHTAPELAAIAGLGSAFFGLSNAMLRFPGDWLRSRHSETTLMSVMIVIAMIGFTGLSLSDGFLSNLLFFFLVGMGVAILCPCLFAMAGRETPHNRAAGLSVAMLVAGVPRIAMPTIVGAVSEALSTRYAFGLCAIALLSALIVIRRFARH